MKIVAERVVRATLSVPDEVYDALNDDGRQLLASVFQSLLDEYEVVRPRFTDVDCLKRGVFEAADEQISAADLDIQIAESVADADDVPSMSWLMRHPG